MDSFFPGQHFATEHHGVILMMYASVMDSCMWLLKADPERRKRRSGSAIRRYTSHIHFHCLHIIRDAYTRHWGMQQLKTYSKHSSQNKLTLKIWWKTYRTIHHIPTSQHCHHLQPPTAAYSRLLAAAGVGGWGGKGSQCKSPAKIEIENRATCCP